MKDLSRIDRIYLKNVYHGFPNHNRYYRTIYQSLKESVRDFRNHNPDAGMDDLIEQFGTPEEIYAYSLEQDSMASHPSSLGRQLLLVIVVAALAFLLFHLFLLIKGHFDHGIPVESSLYLFYQSFTF